DKVGNYIVQKLYLGGDFYTAPAVYVNEGGISGTWQLYYIIRDCLGSITHIRNASVGAVEENSYDAWGRLRNPANYNEVYSAENQPSLLLGRGYTGHEHMPQFGLINMNARLYDPAVGRFLSPDPYVPDGTFSQDFNRYSYARNNPMIYADPDGENPVLIAAIIIGAAAGGYTGYKIADAKGYDMGNWQTYGYMFGSAVIGGVSGYAGATIAAGGGFMANTMGIMYGSMFNSIGMSALSGGYL
ncbi:MAG: RHS repeat-associated core domain-containing protein, partial [Marinilabiliaceae bacterium]|nr:RHS repeat-associated core domain-containing protein [Marinilabiliaceae bacterium]